MSDFYLVEVTRAQRDFLMALSEWVAVANTKTPYSVNALRELVFAFDKADLEEHLERGDVCAE